MKADKNVFPYELGDGTVYTGLTARDYIAIQAMAGISANPELNDWSIEQIAELAYKQADAMIEESKK